MEAEQITHALAAAKQDLAARRAAATAEVETILAAAARKAAARVADARAEADRLHRVPTG